MELQALKNVKPKPKLDHSLLKLSKNDLELDKSSASNDNENSLLLKFLDKH